MSESIPGSSEERRGHLYIVSSSEQSDKHEAKSGLVFYHLTDSSMDTSEVASTTNAAVAHEFTSEALEKIHASEYPRYIARTVLQAAHVMPDLKELYEKVGNTPEDELPQATNMQIQRALAVEDLFAEAVNHLERLAETKQTNNFVDELEDYLDEHDYYDTNVLRICQNLQKRKDFARFNTPVIVASRIVKTMLYLNDKQPSQ